ncbi:MAG: DUF2281 domain-containing protein [Saprospiraceae bacterium]|nr:DUF2281 domain-containing protein [Saprospiraceae bacterium]
MIAEQKLTLYQKIESLPDNLLQELQDYVDGLLAKKKAKKQHGKVIKEQTYEERLKELEELAAKYLTEKPDFENYMREFEESTQDRPLPFRED